MNDVREFRLICVSNSNNDVWERRCLHVHVTAWSEMYKEAGKMPYFLIILLLADILHSSCILYDYFSSLLSPSSCDTNKL